MKLTETIFFFLSPTDSSVPLKNFKPNSLFHFLKQSTIPKYNGPVTYHLKGVDSISCAMTEHQKDEDAMGLAEMGATAVNAASLEQDILQRVEENQPAVPTTDLEAMQQQLWSVRRELGAVRSTVEMMERPPPPPSEQLDDGVPVTEVAAPPPPLVQGELQHAVMKERLSGLEKEAAQLENSLAAAGVAPAPQIPKEAVQEVLLLRNNTKETGGGGVSGSKKRRRPEAVEFDLEEADLFGAAEAAAARGRGASLIETERDRLIRLVCLVIYIHA